MRKNVAIPLVFGILGVAVLVSLGKWQVDRLAWKEGVLADIEARISADPVPLPEEVDRARIAICRSPCPAGSSRGACVCWSARNAWARATA